MKHGVVLAVVAVSLLVAAETQAQELSEEGDRAFWCQAALSLGLERGGFGDSATDARARNSLPILAQHVDAESQRLGLSADAKGEMIISFEDELSYQLNDYLETKSPDALRLDIATCFVA